MFNLKQVSISVAAIAAALTISTLHSTTAQAAIISGQIQGTWESDYDGVGGFSVGDLFTVDYTYDSASLMIEDRSDANFPINLLKSAPLLSLVLNSGTISYTFSSGSILWDEVQGDPARYGQYGLTGSQLTAYDSSTFDTKNFYFRTYSGQEFDGSPFFYRYASAYSINNSTGVYSTYADTNSVGFFTPPTAVPTPALLPGLIGLGVSVMRRRKQTEVAAVSAK